MYPVLFKLWKLPVYSWGLSLALAFVAGTLFASSRGKKKGISSDNIIDLALFVCIGSILFARILYVLLNIGEYAARPVSVFYMRDGGLSFFGGLAGGALVGIMYCKKQKVQIGSMADVIAPAVALGYAIVRIGCLLNGCCYGVESHVAWAMKAAGDGILRHPTQIYSAIYSVIILFVLLAIEAKKKFEGEILWLYVGFYSVARFIVEFWRESPRDYFAPFTSTQVLCVILGILAFGVVSVYSRASSTPSAGANRAKPSTKA
ncbi:MAG: prolipoprotein diacylglyceryl transferase [Clostridia bacterium]|nr:prolipoprotein diacylglyceryl transferase [Clostridia bacterium]